MVQMMSRLAVEITAVDRKAQVLLCRDSLGNEFEVKASLRGKATGMPLVGERWVLLRKGAAWVPDVQIATPQIPIITGSRDGMHPTSIQLLEALARQGLVVDTTSTAVQC